MIRKKKNSRFGRYPSCDMANNAIRFILSGDYREAIQEIALCIQKADGYFHDDISDRVQEIMHELYQERTRYKNEYTFK